MQVKPNKSGLLISKVFFYIVCYKCNFSWRIFPAISEYFPNGGLRFPDSPPSPNGAIPGVQQA